MNKITVTLAIAASILLIGCPDRDPNTPKPNITAKDDIKDCAPACAHVQPMGCPEAQPLVYESSMCSDDSDCGGGICMSGKCAETCEMVCEAFVNEGRQLGLECWQTITKCSEIESLCR